MSLVCVLRVEGSYYSSMGIEMVPGVGFMTHVVSTDTSGNQVEDQRYVVLFLFLTNENPKSQPSTYCVLFLAGAKPNST